MLGFEWVMSCSAHRCASHSATVPGSIFDIIDYLGHFLLIYLLTFGHMTSYFNHLSLSYDYFLKKLKLLSKHWELVKNVSIYGKMSSVICRG